MNISPEIERYYSEFKNEPDRLVRHSLEKIRTQEVISKYLPSGPCKILDIGGATGVYAFWLSEMGHEVHLIDPVPYHIEEARRRAATRPRPPKEISKGEARSLDYQNNSFDFVLLMGPLYHLQEFGERIAALKEAMRVTKCNGIIFSTFISRFAALTDGFLKNLALQPEFAVAMVSDTKTGRHSNPSGKAAYFTTAYFHHPDEIAPEIEAAGLRVEQILSIESFASCIPDIDIKIQNPEYQKILLPTISLVEEQKSLLGIGPHIMGIGRKKVVDKDI
jgi:ubiquinone/menaquinone biosynthesis C-methylase UbiE